MKRKNFSFIAGFVLICILLFVMYDIYAPFFADFNTMVRRNGENLMIGNQTFRAVGVNDYDLAYQNNSVIAQTFAQLHNAGVTTVRFWLFGDGISNGFQPTAGDFNKTRFKQTDYVIYEAKKYNIKLIPTLVNNWTDYGGKDQYIKWIGENPATDETIFYTNNQIKSLFENYISYVLSRKNTYTNVTYADDPTILAWDIMNEPRSTDQNAMNNWLISIAEFIKQHDPNHLVMAGTENAIVTGNNPKDDGKSSDLCANSAIDICSTHLYLFNNTQPLFTNYNEVTDFIETQANYAKQVNKPLLLEEFGIAQDTIPFGENQLAMMKQIINDSKKDGYAGYIVWDWSNTSTSSFTFSPHGDTNGNYSLSDLKKLIN